MKATEILIQSLLHSTRQGFVKWIKSDAFSGPDLDGVYQTSTGIEEPYKYFIIKLKNMPDDRVGYIFLIDKNNEVLDSILSVDMQNEKLLDALYSEVCNPEKTERFRAMFERLLKQMSEDALSEENQDGDSSK